MGDNWITKILTKSDVNGESRLLLEKSLVREHMLPYIEDFDETTGKELTVYDVDTQTSHTLRLKMWSKRSYVLMEGWRSKFIERRGLRKNDGIALRWAEANGRFEFCVTHDQGLGSQFSQLRDLTKGAEQELGQEVTST
ncbi:B3 domain-containing protein At2g33720-like [Henckelia pumila]|uniref:B3 domain-containing protein At2g33720-like n=1 Tax=Henckelia pumila TaxID=405737 RepID=UPI003C6E52A6